jgi:hypothetical protein
LRGAALRSRTLRNCEREFSSSGGTMAGDPGAALIPDAV